MANIRIEWLTDSHTCETCGTSYAEGALVFIDGQLALDLSPTANCYDVEDYQPDVVFQRILKHLGHIFE